MNNSAGAPARHPKAAAGRQRRCSSPGEAGVVVGDTLGVCGRALNLTGGQSRPGLGREPHRV